ncbi:hypothetical protein [Ruminococcus sp.]|uniref:hypothetical protein n=1 Tax=Ruminococcus sp. TaxID=41978 RepID=UPI001B6CB13A|nr:hypothetical protein [Ruminococcus sp.]MBP5433643.1 hypothetical protein [Ruminococcus sp.]
MNLDNCIIKWDINTLKILVWECMTMPHYQALFVTNDFMTKSLVKEWCRMALSRNAEIKSDIITFSNGSSIKFVETKSTARAYRVHKILIDDDVDSKTIKEVLKPYIRDYYEN